ncbi:MAG: hypothetical protein ACRDOD_07010 [Streptosporangiaceae bacterium]
MNWIGSADRCLIEDPDAARRGLGGHPSPVRGITPPTRRCPAGEGTQPIPAAPGGDLHAAHARTQDNEVASVGHLVSPRVPATGII